jgi:hypothetical protein
MRTIDGVVLDTYQEAARAMGLFDNRDKGIMAFEELLDSGAPPTQLRWIFSVLAVEGSPALIIWEAHEDALSADIRDRMLRVTASPPQDLVRNEVLIALQSLLQGLGNLWPKLDCQSHRNANKRLMLRVFAGAGTPATFVLSRMD